MQNVQVKKSFLAFVCNEWIMYPERLIVTLQVVVNITGDCLHYVHINSLFFQ